MHFAPAPGMGKKLFQQAELAQQKRLFLVEFLRLEKAGAAGTRVDKSDPLALLGQHSSQRSARNPSAHDMLGSSKELHQTPFGTIQQFLYCYCRVE